MASLLDLAQARLGGLLAPPQRPSMVGLLGGQRPQGTLASTIAGYTPPQMQAMSNQQVMDYARTVAQTAQQNMAQQMSDLDKALVMGQGGIQVGDREAFGRIMEQIPNLMGTFIGKGSKLWDAKKAEKAVELEKQGKTAQEIWEETGTARFADGELRQEISDQNVKAFFKPKEGNMEYLDKYSNELYGVPYGRLPFGEKGLGEQREAVIKLADAEMKKFEKIGTSLEHPELYKAYEDLKDIDLFQSYAANRSGSYVNRPPDPYIMMSAPNEEQLRSGLLHELQHGIQTKEGWARGGDVEEFLQPNKKAINEAAKKLNELSLARKEGTTEYKQAEEFFNRLRQENPSLSVEEAFNLYKRLAGEAEARLTQNRANLSMEERLQNFPYVEGQYGLDVPYKDLIVRSLLD